MPSSGRDSTPLSPAQETRAPTSEGFGPSAYPKDGQIHARLGELEWGLVQRLCDDEQRSFGNAINYVIRYQAHYPTDLQIVLDRLERLEAQNDLLEAQFEDLLSFTDEIEMLLRSEVFPALKNTALKASRGSVESSSQGREK